MNILSTGDLLPEFVSFREVPDGDFPQPLTKTCLYYINQPQLFRTYSYPCVRLVGTNLQCIFPRKALLAMAARERLHCQMDPLVSLPIVVAVERLWALITFEGSVILLLLLTWMWWILHIYATNKCHLVSWAMYIGHDWTCHGGEVVSTIWSLVVALWRRH